jgi:hypothetical protein
MASPFRATARGATDRTANGGAAFSTGGPGAGRAGVQG